MEFALAASQQALPPSGGRASDKSIAGGARRHIGRNIGTERGVVGDRG